MPAHDLDLLSAAAREAGNIARRFADGSAKVWDKPDDAGPVTEADLAVNDMLARELQAARPDYGWLSEESTDSDARLGRDRVFIVDPIDGTRSFINGQDTWAHSLAIADKGEITAAVVYLPMRDKLYSATRGGGAFLNGEPIRPSTRTGLAGANVLAAKPTMAAAHWPRGIPDFTRSHRPSLAYRLSLVAQGRFDAMMTLRRTWEWDIAAGDLILREAGARSSDKSGQALVFNNPDPHVAGVVAASAPLHAEIIDALRP